MQTKQFLLTSALALGLSLPAAYSIAAPMEHGPMAGGMHSEKMHKMMQPEAVQARLDKLKTALKLSNKQEADWKRYADFMLEHSKAKQEKIKAWRNAEQPKTVPEKMERMLEHARDHVAHMEKANAETRHFYDTLSTEQKAIFDQQHPMMRHHQKRH